MYFVPTHEIRVIQKFHNQFTDLDSVMLVRVTKKKSEFLNDLL